MFKNNTTVKRELSALVQMGYCFICKENQNGQMTVISGHILCPNHK